LLWAYNDAQRLYVSPAARHAAVLLEDGNVAEEEMDPAASGKHTETRLKRWISSVGTVTLPLLAGFSVTSVVVVSDDAPSFELPVQRYAL
jgi:hypothetical protein